MKKFATLALITLLPLAANAATVTLPTQGYSGVPNFNETLTFATFDTSLGTLTQVDITLSLAATSGTLLVDNDSASVANVTVTGGPQASLTSADVLGANVTAQAFVSESLVLSADDGDGSGIDPTANDGATIDISGANDTDSTSVTSLLFLYEDTGINGASYDLDLATVSTVNITGEGGIAGGFTPPNVTGDVTVTYTYTPVDTPVPEPASGALLALGVIGFAVHRRRA
jgi:hypothetical protein